LSCFCICFFFSSRRRHTRFSRDWSSDVCSSDLDEHHGPEAEVEVVFGFWAMVFIVTMMAMVGTSGATEYVESRNFTEPMFVFVIMVIAGTRPIVWLATRMVDGLAKLLPWRNGLEFCFSVLALVPLLGSFITEPAAMTLAAMLLARRVYAVNISH